jgi:AraC-like DNA-binding protein
MKGEDFRTAYQLRMADDLLRYTDLPIKEVARRSGLGSHSNFCVFIRRNHAQSPTQRRMILQQKNDAGRYKL